MEVAITLTLGALGAVDALALINRTRRVSRRRFEGADIPDSDLPSISVCVPARNETHALTDTITALLANDYQKLEILVLDDCSVDGTAEIIRSFAHDGVRFIEGTEPNDGWLGRNGAMEKLRRTANGEYLVFVDVDTAVPVNGLRILARHMVSTGESFVSVLPQRSTNHFLSSAFAPLRYYFEMLDPRPATGSLSVINAGWLETAGGFAPIADAPQPEKVLARSGSFVLADRTSGFTFEKKLSSQYEHVIRNAFPALHTRVISSIIVAAVLFLAGLVPALIAGYGLLFHSAGLMWGAAILYLLGYVLPYYVFVRRSMLAAPLIPALIFPALLIQESALTIISMIQYKAGKVDWKARNVCFPVLRWAKSTRH